jgi:hypothetical protein
VHGLANAAALGLQLGSLLARGQGKRGRGVAVSAPANRSGRGPDRPRGTTSRSTTHPRPTRSSRPRRTARSKWCSSPGPEESGWPLGTCLRVTTRRGRESVTIQGLGAGAALDLGEKPRSLVEIAHRFR